MITRAKFQNFKALRDVEITFDSRLTVLVGPNGSGKTSVLRGVDWLLLAGTGVPLLEMGTFRPETVFLRYHPEDKLRLELEGKSHLNGTDVGLCMELPSGNKHGPEGLRNEDMGIYSRSESSQGNWLPLKGSDRQLFGTATFAQLDAGLLATPTYPAPGPPNISPRGEGLASALAGLALNDPATFRKIVLHLQSIVKPVQGIRFNRFESDKQDREAAQHDPQVVQLRTRKHITESLLFDFTTAKGVHASEVSDGTLIVLGLLALIYAYRNSAILLLDDLDHGLHPKAQMDLVALLRKLLDEFPELQIIATSHSPYILDRLQPNEVRVMALRDDGFADCKPLTEHPKYPKWKDSMSPGEFWSHAGEDWVKQIPEKVAP